MILDVEQVSVSYGNLTILDDVSVKVDENQWLMIVGPNGAGKSTLLHAIGGDQKYSGRILVNGRDLRSMRPAEAAACTAFLDQSHPVNYAFTVEQIVGLGRYRKRKGLLKSGSTDDQEKIEQALVMTGLISLRKRSVLTLSGGELQRTFLAQVLAQDPKLMILDEPTNSLDMNYQQQIFDLISEWAKQPGKAVISVVHDLSLALAYGTHALLLKQGKVLSSGSIRETLAPAELDSAYDMDVKGWMQKLLSNWAQPGSYPG